LLEWPAEEWPPPWDLGALGALNFGAEKCFGLEKCCDEPCCEEPYSDEMRAFEKCGRWAQELDLAVREGSGPLLVLGFA
jgi:hypothetical protein